VTVPPAWKLFVRTAESDAEPPTRIVETERVVVRDGVALSTVIGMVTEWDSEPLVPVTVTV
jgi:hypothetical protein